MYTLFNEAEADAEVARNINKYQRHLQLIEELDKMHLFKNEDGKIYKVVSLEDVSRAEIMGLINQKKDELKELIKTLEDFNALESGINIEDQTSPAPAVAEAAVAETPAPAPQAADPTPPQPPVAENSPPPTHLILQ